MKRKVANLVLTAIIDIVFKNPITTRLIIDMRGSLNVPMPIF